MNLTREQLISPVMTQQSLNREETKELPLDSLISQNYKEAWIDRQPNQSLISKGLQMKLQKQGILIIPNKEVFGCFQKKDVISDGTFGSTYRGRIRGQNCNILEMKKYLKLLAELQNISSDKILKIYGISCDEQLIIITELQKFSLYEFLYRNQIVFETGLSEKMQIALEIAQGIKYLHSFEIPIIHRNLKPQNILLNQQFDVKITDFGMASLIDKLNYEQRKEIIQYVAPEILQGNKAYTTAVDI